jgi:predicted PurR-regulated permease PerM
MLSMASALGGGLMMLLLSIIIAGLLFAEGEQLHRWVIAFSHKVAGPAGENLLRISNSTIRGVVYGFIGAAVAQGALAWFGLAIAGVPNAMSLGLLVCLVSVIPGGPPLLGFITAYWLFKQGEMVWAGFLVAWFLLVVGTIDNVVKSLVIGRNSPLPISLILFGVIGGAIAFGMLGVFLGPTLLALFYTLVRSWVNKSQSATEPVPEEASLEDGSI